VPFSTASRGIWSLTEEGGDIGIIRYQSHPTDRRNKPLVINERNERSEIPRAIARATEVDLRETYQKTESA
jgi:hypothetical protein